MTAILISLLSKYWAHLAGVAGILGLFLLWGRHMRKIEQAKNERIKNEAIKNAKEKSDALSDKYSHLLK